MANASWDVGDRLMLTALGGYQKSDFAQPTFDKIFLQARNTAFGFDMRPTIPVNAYGFNLTNPANWNVQRLVTRENTIKSDYINGQLQGVYEVSPILKLEAGGEYKRFTNSGYQYLTNIFYGTQATSDRAVPDALKYVINRDSLIPYIGGDVAGIYALLGNNRDLTAANLTAGSDFASARRPGRLHAARSRHRAGLDAAARQCGRALLSYRAGFERLARDRDRDQRRDRAAASHGEDAQRRLAARAHINREHSATLVTAIAMEGTCAA